MLVTLGQSKATRHSPVMPRLSTLLSNSRLKFRRFVQGYLPLLNRGLLHCVAFESRSRARKRSDRKHLTFLATWLNSLCSLCWIFISKIKQDGTRSFKPLVPTNQSARDYIRNTQLPPWEPQILQAVKCTHNVNNSVAYSFFSCRQPEDLPKKVLGILLQLLLQSLLKIFSFW